MVNPDAGFFARVTDARLRVVVVAEAVLGAAERGVIELLEEFQNLLAVSAIRVDALDRDLIAREWLLGLRIDYGDRVTIEIPRLAEVSVDFRRRRHARLARVLRHELLLPFLREEEEELLFQRFFRQQRGAADVVALLIVAVKVALVGLDPVHAWHGVVQE